MVSNIRSHTEKLEKLNPTTMEERRWRADMIQSWSIMSGKDRVSVGTWFDLEVDRRREGANTNRNAQKHHVASCHHAQGLPA